MVNVQHLERGSALSKSTAHFARAKGPDLLARAEGFFRWQDGRRDQGLWPFSRTLGSAPESQCVLRDERGNTMSGINFASQDYLSLASHPRVRAAAIRALDQFGPHSAGSPMLTGNSDVSLRLENAIGDAMQREHVVLFPSGWAAGFGTIVGLVRADDHVILDNLAHACLQQGAYAATQNVRRHEHLDIEAVRDHLADIRSKDTKNGILVVTEGLFSMDSDSPNLPALQSMCHEYGATLLVDIAHDFGALGPGGLGHIGVENMVGKVDLVMGAFSKTFATNGGFLATGSHAVKQFIKTFGGSHTFSNALSPLQAAVAAEALAIVRSDEGDALRAKLLANVLHLRGDLAAAGLPCMGDPSAVVPVPIGSEKVARLASALLFERGVFANLVEFPAVAVGNARFRMQVMAGHSRAQVGQAAQVVATVVDEAWSMIFPNGDFRTSAGKLDM